MLSVLHVYILQLSLRRGFGQGGASILVSHFIVLLMGRSKDPVTIGERILFEQFLSYFAPCFNQLHGFVCADSVGDGRLVWIPPEMQCQRATHYAQSKLWLAIGGRSACCALLLLE